MKIKEIPMIEDFRKPLEFDLGLIGDLTYGSAKWAFFTVGVEQGIFRALLQGPSTVKKLSSSLNMNEKVLRVVLDGLVGLNLLKKRGEFYYNTSTSALFAKWGYTYSQLRYSPFWSRLGRMLVQGKIEPIREGKGEEIGFWGSFEEQRLYALRALSGEFQRTLELMENARIFEDVRNFIDVGGGHGIFSIGFVKTHPELRGCIMDLPDVVPITRRFIKAYGLEDKLKVIEGDATRDIPGKYNLAFSSDMLPYRREAISIFKNIYKALSEKGVFVMKDMVPKADWSESFYQLVHMALVMMHLGDPERFEMPPTAKGYMKLMEQCGFKRTSFLGWIRKSCTVFTGWKF